MRPKPLQRTQVTLTLFAGISVLLLSASVLEANTITPPDFSKTLLAPVSQAATAWSNTIPNALADYYTYRPYSNADAVALGFSSACGNTTLSTPSDVNSTADCYTISVRKFGQPMSLDFLKNVGIPGFSGTGLLQADGVTPFFNHTNLTGTLTNVWGYGSGGVGWMPNYPAGPSVTGNAPAAFQNVTFNALFGPGQNGDPNAKGLWHFPAPSIKGIKNRPVYVQWLNDLPNERPEGHDPSVDCGVNAPSCFPYNRIVTHVHGAHTTPESDGLATGWYTPNFALQGENAFPLSAYTGYGPRGTYKYPMTQEAGTIWYHDHAVGTTHLNTNMGMAGFFPITDLNEQSLLTATAGLAKALPNTLYDFGFALQDRHFDISGQIVMPDYGIYNVADPACTFSVDDLPNPNTCPRLQWMKDVDGHLIPYVPGSPLLTNANNQGSLNLTGPFEIPGQGAPFPATSSTLEYFGNIPVVNGVTYGKIDIENRVNRMRFIGGTDSRVFIMQLKTVVNGFPSVTVPFYQVGSEQGLLNKPVLRNYIDLMPGERVDVLVDFSALAAGTKVRMINLGGDEPYAGLQDFIDNSPPPSAQIPEIMEFNVVAKSGNADSISPATLAASTGTPLRPRTVALADGSGLPIVLHGTPVVTRNVSLIEITDQYGRTMPTIDGRGFLPPGVPTTEIIFPNQVDQWDIINTTVDAHPMHIHQIAFQTINRQALDLFVAPITDTLNQKFTPAQYTAAGVALPAEEWEKGEKDTIQCPPGYVTRVRMVFDILGDYVWHCHILSHEEHDMMRPFTVATQAPAPVFVNVPPAVLDIPSYTVSWGGSSLAGAQFELQQSTDLGISYTTIYTGTATKLDLFKSSPGGKFMYRVRVIAPPFTSSVFSSTTTDPLFSPVAATDVSYTGVAQVPAAYTTADAILVLRTIVNLSTPTAVQKARIDVAPVVSGKSTPDNVIDLSDALTILSDVVGKQKITF